MMRQFDEDLKRELQDPEFAAHFANERAKTDKELLKIIEKLDSTSLSNKTRRRVWKLKI